MLKITPVLCRPHEMDNYAYLLQDVETGVSAVLDASEVDAVFLDGDVEVYIREVLFDRACCGEDQLCDLGGEFCANGDSVIYCHGDGEEHATLSLDGIGAEASERAFACTFITRHHHRGKPRGARREQLHDT